MKLDFTVSIKVKFGNYEFILRVLLCIFKGRSPVPLQKPNLLHVNYSYKGNLPTVTSPVYSRAYQMLDPPLMLKKAILICEDFNWASRS